MTASNRTKAGSTASTAAEDTSAVDAPVETEARDSGDTSAPAEMDVPAADPEPVAAAPAAVALATPEPEALTEAQAKFREGRVPIVLAHPVSGIESYRRLRLDSDPDRPDEKIGYPVGATVFLTQEDARAVIMSGYAQIDPEDKAAVRAALRPDKYAAANQA